MLIAEIFTEAAELFLSVNHLLKALEVPAAWFPNARLAGVRLTGINCRKIETFEATSQEKRWLRLAAKYASVKLCKR